MSEQSNSTEGCEYCQIFEWCVIVQVMRIQFSRTYILSNILWSGVGNPVEASTSKVAVRIGEIQ